MDSRPESTTGCRRPGFDSEHGNNKTLSVASIYMKGIISNKVYFEKLLSENLKVCIQEHWLWEFQKNWVTENFIDFGAFIRCHDSNEPIPNTHLPRGQSGVAILWSKTLSDKVT